MKHLTVILFLVSLTTAAAKAELTCNATIGSHANVPLELQEPGMLGSDSVGPMLSATIEDVTLSVKADYELLGTKAQPQLNIRISGPVSLSIQAAPAATHSDGSPSKFEYRQALYVGNRQITLDCRP